MRTLKNMCRARHTTNAFTRWRERRRRWCSTFIGATGDAGRVQTVITPTIHLLGDRVVSAIYHSRFKAKNPCDID